MSKKLTNHILPSKENADESVKEFIFYICFSLILFAGSLLLANWILPENCFLFSDNIRHPQACHTFPMPDGCEPCDTANASVASIIGGVGIFCSVLFPFIIPLMRNYRKLPIEQPKLFD